MLRSDMRWKRGRNHRRRMRAGWAVLVMLAGCGACHEKPGATPVSPTATVTPVKPATEAVAPGGKRSAHAFSIVDELRGNTQVAVDFGRGGGGVFAVDLPYVPLTLRWVDDDHLVIGYPKELTPSKQETRIQNYQDVVTVSYEPYAGAGAQMATLEKVWGESTVEARRKQLPPKPSNAIVVDGATLRGTIVRVSENEFRYDYYDVDEPDSISAALQAKGYQGGGETWAGIVHGLVMIQRPALMSQLRLDPEAEGLAVWSNDRQVLEAVAALVTRARAEPKLLDAAIAKAKADGELE